MQPRAAYLARLLVSRTRQLEATLADDALDEHQLGARRQELVAKILVVEEGITDGLVVERIASALPQVRGQLRMPDRELTEFAKFLSRQLRLE